jgi:hypothetical protein
MVAPASGRQDGRARRLTVGASVSARAAAPRMKQHERGARPYMKFIALIFDPNVVILMLPPTFSPKQDKVSGRAATCPAV